MKKVIIASLNPVKINAVKIGFQKMFPNEEFIFEGKTFPSGVPDQPASNSETLTGARNRALSAFVSLPDAHYYIGIEGGIEKIDNEMEAFAWVFIKNNLTEGKARTGTFFLPPGIIELINQGKELGEADDIVFGHTNSKQDMGAVGILTGNIIDRTSYYSEAVVLALIPFKNSELYNI